MLNEYQLQLLMKERERRLSREWQYRMWLQEAQMAADQTWEEKNPRWLLKQTLLRALTIALLIVLLALGLTTIARAQSLVGLTNCSGILITSSPRAIT